MKKHKFYYTQIEFLLLNKSLITLKKRQIKDHKLKNA